MAEEPLKKDPEAEIQAILSDLDDILGGLKTADAPAPVQFAPPPQTPAARPPSAAPQSPTRPAPAPAPPPSAPPPAPPPALGGLTLELPTRPGPSKPPIESSVSSPKPASEPPKPAPKPIELPKPVELPKGIEAQVSQPAPAQAPKAAEPAKPAPAPALPPLPEIPAGIGKDQVRRVAILYSADCAREKDTFVGFLDQSAQTISKKPLFLRKVLIEEISASTEPKAMLDRLKAVGAVAALAVIEGMPESKARDLGEMLTSSGIMFRSIPLSEIQKRSLAVDLIVDMMLLSPET